MGTVVSVIACIPLAGWLTWRAIKPFMLCRDVEAGNATKDTLIYLIFEATIYIAVPVVIVPPSRWQGFTAVVFGGMCLIGAVGMIRTLMAYARMRKSSNRNVD